MTIESKNDENNSGNLYLKQKMVCILYTWHHFMPSMFDMQVNCPKSVLSCRKTIEENRVNRTNKNKKENKTQEKPRAVWQETKEMVKPETGWS